MCRPQLTMRELLAFSTHHKDLCLLEKGELGPLLHLFGLSGIELLPVGQIPASLKEYIVGVHLPFQPVWLPFWFGDKEYLHQIFPGEENLERFFGGPRQEDFIERVASWLEAALSLRPEYVVIHASHCGTEEVFSLNFRYDKKTVLSAVAELLNKALVRIKARGWPQFLFENLWWPGLQLMEDWEIEYFFSRLDIPTNKLGLVLDTGHLLNASYLLYPANGPVPLTQALSLLEERLALWPKEYRGLIKVVHLNFSPNAHLFVPDEKGYKAVLAEPDPLKRYVLARERVLLMDPHLPFDGVDLRKFLEDLEPDYLVHELRFKEISDLTAGLLRQKKCIKRI